MNSKDEVIYITGSTKAGIEQIGGVWRLWSQEGFPVEMSHLLAQGKGMAVDWCEAMADAATTGELAAMMKHVEAFLSAEAYQHLERGFNEMLKRYTPDQMIKRARDNGRKYSEAFA